MIHFTTFHFPWTPFGPSIFTLDAFGTQIVSLFSISPKIFIYTKEQMGWADEIKGLGGPKQLVNSCDVGPALLHGLNQKETARPDPIILGWVFLLHYFILGLKGII